ncbi:MAG TPA: cation-translocating P-type ATPase [Ilumatobacteraceae bacterium]|nr:cation-translocating P-type ATPase [Ilumatobacteraceae bacterium]
MSSTSPPLADGADASVRTDWHRRSADQVLAELGSSLDGLDDAQITTRRAEVGSNELEEAATTSPLRLIWGQISSVMVLILIGAAFLSLLLGKFLEAGAIGAIVVLFTALGFYQEYRAEQAIAALRRMAVPSARVTRSGRMTSVPVGELVPGDIVHLDAGTVVPADLRLVDVASLRIEEATLTGESEPIDKEVDAVDRDDLALGDRLCMAYSGTQVAAGRGQGIVVATGMRTELGRIATLLQGVESEPTPLQQRLDRVGKQLALIGIAVALAVVVMGAISGETAADLVLTAISVAVAVIPEGLPAVVTFTLAIGSQRMLRRQALIRKLPAVETLGSVTVICSDKTGTLTQNRMTVTVLDVAGQQVRLSAGEAEVDLPTSASIALVAGALCNDGAPDVGSDGNLGWLGDPTETALLQAATDAGLDVAALRTQIPRIDEQPFDSTRKRMSTIHGAMHGAVPELAELPQDVALAFVKGAVDGMIDRTTAVWDHGSAVPFDDAWRRRITEANDALAAAGMRVLGLAFRPMSSPDDDPETDLILIGLVGIIDPPRAEVRDAVAVCRRAGIRPVMITGDHPLTAVAIATDLGISDTDQVLVGAQLDHLDDDEFAAAVAEVSVFARVSPEHKLRIVGALQQQHQVVAMTGDGVNDAPALKRADIGVAMGITGTDVSKEAADMVLRDDNFATIVAAVEEGRVIYDNLRRFVSFAVAGNLGKIIVMLLWPIPFLVSGSDAGTAIAFLPLQLLWLNLMTDGLLGLSMGVEPAEKLVMERPPHSPADGLWANGLGRRTAWIGAVIGLVTLGLGFGYYAADADQWQTIMFTTLAFMQVGQAFATRSSTESLRTIGWRTNRVMLGIASLVVVLQLAAIYTPLREFLDLDTLGAVDLAVCAAAGFGLLALVELVKAIHRR